MVELENTSILNSPGKKNILVVYTALFGSYDELQDPTEKFSGCDFVCFTDQKNIKSEVWRIHLLDSSSLANNLRNRQYKMLPHVYLTDYRYSIYIDANIKVLKNPSLLLDQSLFRINNFIVAKHFKRQSVFLEGAVLLRSGRVGFYELLKQTILYIKSGFTGQVEMGENNVIFREHASVAKLSEFWWQEFKSGVKRDQLCLPYCSWALGNKVVASKLLSARLGDFFAVSPHKVKLNSPLHYKIARFIFKSIPYYIIYKIMVLINK
ncbi:glycosyltransferase domain-containing protein [Litchfieldella xinjiangensis]|uniref:glycosyltransferase domain-containing protein n=1 Tax=Litchfieldella xinjiangensis TaxID=1166948 RepID=UPI0009DE1E35|nr:glycosyltransferase domain-containing protein [Halomonas xinjiangensis]